MGPEILAVLIPLWLIVHVLLMMVIGKSALNIPGASENRPAASRSVRTCVVESHHRQYMLRVLLTAGTDEFDVMVKHETDPKWLLRTVRATGLRRAVRSLCDELQTPDGTRKQFITKMTSQIFDLA
jgi:hypothetical protein